MIHRVQHHLAASVDQVFCSAVLRRPGSPSRAAIEPSEAIARLRALLDSFHRDAHFADPDSFFLPPPLPSPERRRVRALAGGGEVVDLRWPSGYAPFFSDIAARYRERRANRWARVRLFRAGPRPRPTAILVHGYMGGHFALEERIWGARAFLAHGLDVALAVLPFHGPRREGDGARPAFPSRDPRVTIDAFRQAISDLRGLVALLRAEGAPLVGAFGMSLGGYTAALLATVEPRLGFVVPVTPLASIPDFLREGSTLPGTASQKEALHALLEEVHGVVSPLRRPVLVPRAGRLVIAGEADRITPLAHARRIAEHFEAPLEVFAGGHLLQAGRGRAFRRALSTIDRLGAA